VLGGSGLCACGGQDRLGFRTVVQDAPQGSTAAPDARCSTMRRDDSLNPAGPRTPHDRIRASRAVANLPRGWCRFRSLQFHRSRRSEFSVSTVEIFVELAVSGAEIFGVCRFKGGDHTSICSLYRAKRSLEVCRHENTTPSVSRNTKPHHAVTIPSITGHTTHLPVATPCSRR